ncbi:MAG: DUF4430 domain-containing protein [Promethearchaeota archaeon]
MKNLWKGVALLSIFFTATVVLVAFQGEIFGTTREGDPASTGGEGGGSTGDGTPTTVTNLTLILDYGNGTIDRLENLNVTGVEPSVFDLLNQTTNVTFQDYGWDVLITGINGQVQNDHQAWHFWVNGEYSPVGAGAAKLSNDSWIDWRFQ